MLLKSFSKITILILVVYCGLWSFNHIHPWIGIAIIVITIYYITNEFINFLKRKSK